MLFAGNGKCTVECCLLPVRLEGLSLGSIVICHENIWSILWTFASKRTTWMVGTPEENRVVVAIKAP